MNDLLVGKITLSVVQQKVSQ